MTDESNLTSSKTYEGSCHCAQTKLTAKVSPALEDQKVVSCNCSICSRNGYLFVYVDDGDVTFPSGKDSLKVRTFHDVDLGSLQLHRHDGKNMEATVYDD
ncbi:MAG: hypothetical protein M1823_000036 [Watsoniomyces obsoletus]|nr:MAG: hypothetical protein M1823_000036 [Watsoniomyces obsoletus]